MKRARFLVLSLVVVSALTLALARGQTSPSTPAAAPREKAEKADPNEPKANDVEAFMRLKLRHSQKVLEGVVLEDFDLIAKNAQQLGLLAQDENWRVYQTLEYRQHSTDFERIAGELTKAARAKNIDGAALAYMQLTMSCVNCHKYTRDIGTAPR